MDKDTTELQSLMEVIPDEEEVAIDVVPLATKPPTILVRLDDAKQVFEMELCLSRFLIDLLALDSISCGQFGFSTLRLGADATCSYQRSRLSCLLKEQLLEPALNLTVHCCGLEFRVLNGYDQKSFDEERGLN
ncbi:hypothetical protein Tco_1490682 [Tanacetum coccineum]